MGIVGWLFGGWVALVAVWLVNHYYYQNQKYEMEYRRGLHPRR